MTITGAGINAASGSTLIMNLRVLPVFALALCSLMARPVQAQAQAESEVARSDSLSKQMEAMAERYYTKADKREERNLRIARKVAVGTATSITLTAVVIGAQVGISGSPSILEEKTIFLVHFLFLGNTIGFPLGVSRVDPYDSLPKTLLGGVIPALAGASLGTPIGATMVLVGPIIGSLYMSEASRKPPQSPRVSFGLAPTLNRGLSAVARLRF